MNIRAAILLVLLSSSALSQESPYGLWKFPGTVAFVEIFENGNVTQCRIAEGFTVTTANGKFDGDRTITWEPVTSTDLDGTLIESDFNWQQDEVTVVKNAITLSGPYGTFRFEAASENMPEECTRYVSEQP